MVDTDVLGRVMLYGLEVMYGSRSWKNMNCCLGSIFSTNRSAELDIHAVGEE